MNMIHVPHGVLIALLQFVAIFSVQIYHNECGTGH